MPDEPQVLEQVHDLVRQGLPGNPQFFVRLHPKDDLARYEHLRTDPARSDIVWTLARDNSQSFTNWSPDPAQVRLHVNTIRHGDVNVHCRYSTMMLDYAAQDKPVAVIAYDAEGSTARGKMYEAYEHLQPVVESQAIRIADSPSDLRAYLIEALETPERNSQARRRLAELMLGPTDGHGGVRAAQAVLRLAMHQPKRFPLSTSFLVERLFQWFLLVVVTLTRCIPRWKSVRRVGQTLKKALIRKFARPQPGLVPSATAASQTNNQTCLQAAQKIAA
jgi:hypothetical protein